MTSTPRTPRILPTAAPATGAPAAQANPAFGTAVTSNWPGAWVADRLGVQLHGEQLPALLGLALRRNPRRAHLLVSTVLGKHLPQHPDVVYRAGKGLGERVRTLLGPAAGRTVVLGYAETATALGHSVADGIGDADYLHSTRREVPGAHSAGGFEEEHSHASSHLLLPEDPDLLAGPGPLVLVDDELSTGRTVRNTVTALHRHWPRDQYVLVTLVDVRSAADTAELQRTAAALGARIDVVALATGTVGLPADVLERGRLLVAHHDKGGEPSDGSGTEKGAAAIPADRPAAAGTTTPSSPSAAPPRTGGTDPARSAPGARRIELDWPMGLPEGARHGATPAHRARLESALPHLARQLATALPNGARRVLVLGTEELMYTPLRLAGALADHGTRSHGSATGPGGPDGPHATTAMDDTCGLEVCFSATTRSPVLPVDDPGYAIRSRLTFPAPEPPGDGERYVHNVAGGGWDAIILITDSAADTSELHAAGGLLDQLARHTPHVGYAILPTRYPLPRPLRGPDFSSYAAADVGWLLQDFSDVALEAPTEEREEAVQRGGAHYAESLPVEYQPGPEYQQLFHAALRQSADRVAQAVATVTDTLLAERSRPVAGGGTHRPVLVSLARAGTPVGILMRRWAQYAHGIDLPHYTLSIVRGRGIDTTALRWLATHHNPTDVVFVDGWTGKGAITTELANALAAFPTFNPSLAVLADPGGCVATFGTREDYLVPSACLNSTVSGLISRTVLRAELVGPDEFHGAKHYRELADVDMSDTFLDVVAERFRLAVRGPLPAGTARAPHWAGWNAVRRVSDAYGINDVNLVKPGVGETTRVLLRRVPWRILTRRGAGTDLDHIRLLAAERGVRVEETDDLPYACMGLIHPRYTRGATGDDGKAARS